MVNIDIEDTAKIATLAFENLYLTGLLIHKSLKLRKSFTAVALPHFNSTYSLVQMKE